MPPLPLSPFLFFLLLLLLLLSTTTTQASQPRIVGGHPAPHRLSKHLALLHLTFTSSQTARCTATILTPRHLITAAHCFQSRSLFGQLHPPLSYALIAERNPRASFNNTKHPAIFIHSVHLHKRFRRGSNDFRFDIAVIRLARPIPSRWSHPVTIVPPPQSLTLVHALGYGRTAELSPIPTRVQSAKVRVRDVDACARQERSRIATFLERDTMVCAVAKGWPNVADTDTCYGDSGGPLFLQGRPSGRQFAITSFSTGTCGQVGGRAYYGRLDRFERALRKVVRGRGRGRWRRIA